MNVDLNVVDDTIDIDSDVNGVDVHDVDNLVDVLVGVVVVLLL